MVQAIGLTGLDAHVVGVEATDGAPQIVGVPETAVRELRVRVRSALSSIGVDASDVGLVVDSDRAGTALDLAAAVAILVETKRIPAASVEGIVFIGELSLTGAIRPVCGIVSRLQGAVKLGIKRVVVPSANRYEAALVDGVDVCTAETLEDVVRWLGRGEAITRAPSRGAFVPADIDMIDFADVRGQLAARRTFEIAAAGGHHVLMVGAPGAGKTMLARRLPTIMPPLSESESLEVTALHSVAGRLNPDSRGINLRPFRAPHHSISTVGLVGGDKPICPGEVSLAHRGVLFLDEILEFKRDALDALREPVREGKVTISRSREQATFLAHTQIVAATNPCPCGFHGERDRCTCTPERLALYQARMTGGIFDQFALRVHLHPASIAVAGGSRGESSAAIRARVVAAREFAREQFKRHQFAAGGIADREVSDLFAQIRARLKLTQFQERNILAVAQTIAHLDQSERTHKVHLGEAVPLVMMGSNN